MPTLYDTPLSLNRYKVRPMLALSGIPHRRAPVDRRLR